MKSKGFTLIEVLIVLAIFGILGAIIHDAWGGKTSAKKLQEDGCVLTATAKGDHKVYVSKNNWQYPNYETYKCERGDLLRTKTRHTHE